MPGLALTLGLQFKPQHISATALTGHAGGAVSPSCLATRTQSMSAKSTRSISLASQTFPAQREKTTDVPLGSECRMFVCIPLLN